jgi:hypothetical protein
MTLQIKICIAIAIAVLAFVAGVAGWANYKVGRLDDAVAEAKHKAAVLERAATLKEAESAGYVEKIAYLERRLGEINNLARKQDEQLERLSNNSRRVRGDLDRARRTRVVPADDAALCGKLAELGHACE